MTDTRDKRPKPRDTDVPSDTVGMPSTGDGASARKFARDLAPGGDNHTTEEKEGEGKTE